ncbi:PREDICTED: zinc finger and BTB domain-containing protein 6 [Gekko japonicus]|uniref:Zinc finger and BTB domain-containing protein 6 n=1 Tax=Gekko japonicus TaxID=146911 RepID=A0ABM1KJM2_GEKJA|nr:PREDICTED: zinc finger and BTB domain-containing protein 6 [Gekko japonicus]
MAADSDVLHFQFEQQGDAVLQKMNLLRQQNLFCDVSIYINDTEFQGHKVIFAACSTFMRDQFLLSQSQQVRITILQSAEVGRKLLLSCYTGALEVKKKELLKYLTAASYLQMVHIVEKCTEALSRYLEIDVSVEGNSRSPEKCHSSDMDLGGKDANLDKDCEIIEISEDSSVNLEDNIKQEKGDVQQQPLQNLVPERKDVKSPEISTVEIEYKDDEICIFQMDSINAPGVENEQYSQPSTSSKTNLYFPETQHSLINSTVESRISEVAGGQFPGFRGVNPEGAVSAVGGFQNPEDSGYSWRHQCPKCPRGFLHLDNYLRHLKMHKLFLCLQCGKTFTQKKNLNRHIRGHMGIRPFQCMVCLKTFTAKSTLQDHLNIHSGDRPYKCHCCDMDFKHKSALKKHLTSVHGRGNVDKAAFDSITEVRIDYD